MDIHTLRHIAQGIRKTTNRVFSRTTPEGRRVIRRVIILKSADGLSMLALLIGFSFGLSGCHTQKHLTQSEPTTEEVTQAEPEKWHTCLVQNAQGILTIGGQTISANCTMQAVRDSLVVLSIMPMLGIELMRIEATPTEIIGIDKMNRQYAKVTYDEINQIVTPTVHWDDFLQLASGELPTDTPNEAVIGYSALGYSFVLRVVYPEILTNVPVRAMHIDLSRYQQKTFSELLQ